MRCKPRQLKLFEKDVPGDSVQVDVKVIKLKREKVFQYTALDDCTRFRVLRLEPRLNQHSSLHVLRELQRALPFAIKNCSAITAASFRSPLSWRSKPRATAASKSLATDSADLVFAD